MTARKRKNKSIFVKLKRNGVGTRVQFRRPFLLSILNSEIKLRIEKRGEQSKKKAGLRGS